MIKEGYEQSASSPRHLATPSTILILQQVRTRLEERSDIRLLEVYEEAEVAGVKIPIPARIQVSVGSDPFFQPPVTAVSNGVVWDHILP